MKTKLLLLILVSFVAYVPSAVAETAAAKTAPNYVPQALEKETTLTSVGSDTMDELVRLWVDRYKKLQPSVRLQVASRGSATAPAALVDGSADLGPMARPMRQTEVEDFYRKYGFRPTGVKTAIAAIGVYVSEDNPIKSLSYAQLDQIFSAEKKRGEKAVVTTWEDLGVKDSNFGKKPILPVLRTDDTYAFSYFRQQVLLQGDFTKSQMVASDLPSLFKTLQMNPSAISFGLINEKAENVRLVPISRGEGEPAVLPTKENVLSAKYPLSRDLSIYVAREPGGKFNPALEDFLRFVLSAEGQKLVGEQGLVALPASSIKQELEKL